MRSSNQKSKFKPPPPAKPMPAHLRKVYSKTSPPPPRPSNPQPVPSNSPPNSGLSNLSQSLMQGMSIGAGSEIGRRVVGSILDLGSSTTSQTKQNNMDSKITYEKYECQEFLQKFKECILNSNEFSNENCD